jgi:hypothetical protein
MQQDHNMQNEFFLVDHTDYTGSAKRMYTYFNERKLCCMLVLNVIIHHKLITSYNRAQYRFRVPVQLIEVLKVVAVSG